MNTPSPELEASRLAIAWEIVSRSDIDKSDPAHLARMVRHVLAILFDPEGSVSVLPVAPRDSKGSRGAAIRLTYNFTGGPTSIPLTVFVHVCDENEKVAFQGDHQPPRPTVFWSERTAYSRDLVIPSNAPPGLYRVRLGLYDAFGGHARLDLDPRDGAFAADYRSYEVGTLRIE